MKSIKNLLFIFNFLILSILSVGFINSLDIDSETSSGSDSEAFMSFDDLEDSVKETPEEPELIKLINLEDINGAIQAINKGVDVNCKSNSGKSALQLAMDKSLHDVVVLLSSKISKISKTLNNNANFKKLINSKLEFPIHNLIMLFDNIESFSGNIKTNRFVVNQLFLAQSQEVCPILVSGNTLRLSLQILLKEKTDDDLRKVVQLKDDSWDFYKTVRDDIYLLVPKKYSQNSSDVKFSSEALKAFSKEALSIGFKIDKEDIFEKVYIDQINETLYLKKPTRNQKVNIDVFKSIFITQDDLDYFKQEKFAPFKRHEQINKTIGIWNIYLSGHGMYSKNYLSGLGSEVGSKEKSEICNAEDAEIAGMSLQNFRDLISYFDSDINVNFLYYISCYAGGYNIILPFKGKSLRFTVAVGSITDSVVTLVTKLSDECSSDPDKVRSGRRDLISFFNELNRFTNKDLKPTKFDEDQLKNILSYITPKDITKLTLSYFPQILLPGAGAFKVLINDGIQEITDDLISTSGGNIDIKDKNALLVRSAQVKNKVNISPKYYKLSHTQEIPIMISMIHGIALHKFDEVEADKIKFLDFFQKTMFSLEPAFPKYFYFKKLILADESAKISLSNVFIKVQAGSLSGAFINGKKVYFDGNLGKTLSSKTSLKDLLYKHDLNADEFEGISDYLNDEEIGKLLMKVIVEKLLCPSKTIIENFGSNKVVQNVYYV